MKAYTNIKIQVFQIIIKMIYSHNLKQIDKY